ncbi:MAG TPA: glycosyltransferase [Halanaerobiaceae bacterium]|nr:glycosyltransferase [Halanaerobiaceae bacterium]
MDKLVSIIMPVYNSARYLSEAIESCLDQTYRKFELIIIDDGSNDDSKEIIEFYWRKYPDKIKVHFFQKNQGAAAARNKGIKMARGDYLVFADSDDIQDKERIQQIIESIKRDKVDMVFNNCLMIDENGQSLGKDLGFPEILNNSNGLLLSLQRNYFWTSLATVKNDRLVYFDESLMRSEDYDLFLKLLFHGWKFTFIKEPLVKYRIHSGNDSSDYEKARKATIKILNKYPVENLYTKLKEKGHPEKDIYITFGIMSIIKKEYDNAVDYLNKAKDMAGDNYIDLLQIFFYSGVAYYYESKLKDSYESFKKAYLQDSEDSALLNNLGVLECLVNEDLNKAKELIEKALLLKPGYLDAIYNLDRIKEGKRPDKITEKFLRKNLVHTYNYKL